MNLVINGLAIYLTAKLLPGVHVANFITAIIVAFVMAIVNVLVKPLVFILTLPVTILTLGLFIFVLNALMVLFVGALVKGFVVDGLLWALIFSAVVSIINTLLHKVTPSSI